MSRYAECRTVDNGAYLISACCYVTNQFTAHLGVEKWENTALFFYAQLTYNFFFFRPIPNAIYIFESAPNILSFWFYLAKIQWGIIFYGWVGRQRREREWNEGRRIRKRKEKGRWPEKTPRPHVWHQTVATPINKDLLIWKRAIAQNPFCVINTNDYS